MKPLATLIEKKIKIKVERQNCILEEEQASNGTFGHLDRGDKNKNVKSWKFCLEIEKSESKQAMKPLATLKRKKMKMGKDKRAASNEICCGVANTDGERKMKS